LHGAGGRGHDAAVTPNLRVPRVATLVLAGGALAATVVVGVLALSWGNPLPLVIFLAPYALLRAAAFLQARRVVPGLGRLPPLELFTITGWLALGTTLACIALRFPIRTAGANMHGAGFSGGESNALLFPWLHLAAYALSLRLVARIRARRAPSARPSLRRRQR
jgi:hypothetical protein